MLPIDQILMWQQLFTLLSSLPTDSSPDLKISLDRVIEFFETQILTQDIDSIPDPIAGKMRSYLTESHRLLRLLPMDAIFISAARNPITLQQRRQSYQQNLDLLLRYCQAVING
jgi:hypothetical protein